MRRRRLAAGRPGWTLALSLLLLSACGDEDKSTEPETEPSQYLAPVSAEAVLTNLIRAYEDRDIEEYEKLFDPDEFRFVFDPTDVEQDPGRPHWEWVDEDLATSNLFTSAMVLDVRLDFVLGPVEDADSTDAPRGSGWKKLSIREVDLEVELDDPQFGENVIWKVVGDRAHFFFHVDPEETVDGLPVWRIVEWRDERVGGLVTIETTWGAIKKALH